MLSQFGLRSIQVSRSKFVRLSLNTHYLRVRSVSFCRATTLILILQDSQRLNEATQTRMIANNLKHVTVSLNGCCCTVYFPRKQTHLFTLPSAAVTNCKQWLISEWFYFNGFSFKRSQYALHNPNIKWLYYVLCCTINSLRVTFK